jgi:G3E family GTPase
MLAHIPTHLIAGPLGAGKTSLIRALLEQKPVDERWAVLINEFGRIGLDAALLGGPRQEGIELAEIPGGCLCCVNGAPFQVGLGRLLRSARPDRLLIEPSGLGHPLEVLQQLGAAPWAGVLALQPLVMVLDARALAAGSPLPDSQQQALGSAGLLVLNKSESLGEADRARIVARLPALPLRWTHEGRLSLVDLPGHASSAVPSLAPEHLPDTSVPLPTLWRDPEPICQTQAQAEGWSIGWRWHPSQRFDLPRVERWLAGLQWQRAKLVLQGENGWYSANALAGAELAWRSSEWRRDSRLELIFRQRQDSERLKAAMLACRLG